MFFHILLSLVIAHCNKGLGIFDRSSICVECRRTYKQHDRHMNRQTQRNSGRETHRQKNPEQERITDRLIHRTAT